LQALTNRPIVKSSEASDSKTDSPVSDATIEVMKGYFHVQDRDVLLKYLRDTLVSPGGR
jgi:hypothetical protein